MHPFNCRGRHCARINPLERVMGENWTTTETNSWHGASSLVYEVSHCWGREYFFDYALLNYFCENSFRQEAMTSNRLLLSHTSPPNSLVSLSYFIPFFCQSKSNILRYLKPVLFIKLSLNQWKIPDCYILNFGLTPITPAGVPPIGTRVYHYTMVCLPLKPPCLEPNIFAA